VSFSKGLFGKTPTARQTSRAFDLPIPLIETKTRKIVRSIETGVLRKEAYFIVYIFYKWVI